MKRSILIVGLALMSIGCTEEPLGEINHKLPMWERVIGKWKVANSDEYDYVVFSEWERMRGQTNRTIEYNFYKKGGQKKYGGLIFEHSDDYEKIRQDSLLSTYNKKFNHYEDSLYFKNKKELVFVYTDDYFQSKDFKYILHK